MVIPFCLYILIIHGMTLKNHSIIVHGTVAINV